MPYAGPTEIHVKGEDWIRDGSWFVKKSLVDQYGGDVENVPPQMVEQNRMSYPDGVNTLTVEQRAHNQGDPTGQDQFYKYRNSIGEQEFRRRADLSSSLGVNRSTDTTPAGVLADELFYGHMDQLPGTQYFFNMRGDGTPIIKDRMGNVVPNSPQLLQAAQQAVKQGYGTGQAHSGGGLPPPPTSGVPDDQATTPNPLGAQRAKLMSHPITSGGVKQPPISPPVLQTGGAIGGLPPTLAIGGPALTSRAPSTSGGLPPTLAKPPTIDFSKAFAAPGAGQSTGGSMPDFSQQLSQGKGLKGLLG